MKICIWQHRPSLHQLALIEALNKKCELIWIIENERLNSLRLNMGWNNDCSIDYYLISNYNDMVTFVETLDSSTVHLFGGIRASNNLSILIKYLINKKRRVYIQSEASDYFGIKGKLRVLRGVYDNRKIIKKIEGVFAIGSLGVKFYKMIGVETTKIFPWGYFVKKTNFKLENESNVFQIIFVGRLIKTKGVEVLLKSLKYIKNDYYLTIIGNGVEEDVIKKMINNDSRLRKNVTLINALPNEEVIREIAKSDLLVLPSVYKEGWGAVVSEALMQGTRVIASDKCGSSVLLSNSLRGAVVKSGSIESLREELVKQIMQGKVSEATRNKIIDWSKCISGEVAAQYMLDCIKYKKPEVPWL
ncbi:glycosyltransferase [Tenacibaculum aiptasiae]|uniref:glycosyltransferase n=1 Tax=Tenacibaculum aiptasiae TaxID=426481 RepID=UPI003B5A45A0